MMARKREIPLRDEFSRVRFNGAAPMMARKLCLFMSRCQESSALQWSRANDGAET